MTKFTEEQIDNFAGYLGEGFHTAFRKAAFSPESNEIWQLIKHLDNSEWESVLRFVAGPMLDYADELVKEAQV